MIKGKLKCGDAMYVVRVEHFVTQRVFATALTENYYSKGESFPESITKKEAEKIHQEEHMLADDESQDSLPAADGKAENESENQVTDTEDK